MDFLSSINTKNVKAIQLSGTTHCVGDSILGSSSLLNICGLNSTTTDGNGGTILIAAGGGGATKGCGGDIVVTAGYSNSGSTICGGGDAYFCAGNATIGKAGDIFIMSGQGDSANNTGDIYLYRGNSSLVLASTPEGNICVPKYICALSGVCSPNIYGTFKGTTFSGVTVCATDYVKTSISCATTCFEVNTLKIASGGIILPISNSAQIKYCPCGAITSWTRGSTYYNSGGTQTFGFGGYGTADGEIVYGWIGKCYLDTNAIFYPDGSVNLYYDDALRFCTVSTGVCVSGVTQSSTCITSPITCGATCLASPVLYGSTCSNSPLHCGACGYFTTRICSPIITGSTRVCSPIVCGTSCVRSPLVSGTTLQSATCALVATDLVFSTGSNSCLRFNSTSSGAGSAMLICGNNGAASSNGGPIIINAGTGGATKGAGGCLYLYAGSSTSGGTTSGTGGGLVYICGGGATTGAGGDICIRGGNGQSCEGQIFLYQGDGTLRLNTNTTGVCVSGTLNTSSTLCSTTCVRSSIVCATTCFVGSGAGLTGTASSLTAGSATNATCLGGTLAACYAQQIRYNNFLYNGNEITLVVCDITLDNLWINYRGNTSGITTYMLGTGKANNTVANVCVNNVYSCGCVYSPVVCAGTTFTVGTNILLTTGANRCIAWVSDSSTNGYATIICGQGSGVSHAGGHVCITAGCGVTTGGNVYIYGGNSNTGCVVLHYGTSIKLCTVSNGICLGTNCGFGADWIATSDIRTKKDIVPISNALSMITQLQGVCYHLCDDCECEVRIGLIAQEVEKIIPEIVSHSTPSEDDVKYGITDNKLGLKYDKLTAVLIEAIKEQQTQIIELKSEINKLKEK